MEHTFYTVLRSGPDHMVNGVCVCVCVCGLDIDIIVGTYSRNQGVLRFLYGLVFCSIIQLYQFPQFD